jgi:hypothetical protein
MSRNLIKIEAEDTSPLDVPGRPLTTIRPNTDQSWDQQISPPNTEDELEQGPSMRRFGAPEPAPPRRAPRIEDLLPPPIGNEPIETRSTPDLKPVAEPQPIPEPEPVSAPTPQPIPEPLREPDAALKPEPEEKPRPAEQPAPIAKPEQKTEPEAPKRLPPRMRKKMEQEPKAAEVTEGAADALVSKQANTQPAPEQTAPVPPPGSPSGSFPDSSPDSRASSRNTSVYWAFG